MSHTEPFPHLYHCIDVNYDRTQGNRVTVMKVAELRVTNRIWGNGIAHVDLGYF